MDTRIARAADVSLSVLETIRIASPCSARWEDMTQTNPGDDRVRHCGECRLNVHNLSAMSREEAEALVASHFSPGGANAGKRLCGQWRRRADGTIIFGDCPVGLARVRARARRSMARVCAMLGITTLVSGALARAERRGWDPHKYESFTLVSRWIGTDAAAQTITRTAGMVMPMVKGEVVMGKVSPAPTPMPTNPADASSGQGGKP